MLVLAISNTPRTAPATAAATTIRVGIRVLSGNSRVILVPRDGTWPASHNNDDISVIARHAVEENHAVEVIVFVLDDAGVETIGGQRDRRTFDRARLDLDPTGARHQPAELGYRETAFPPFFDVVSNRSHLRVDEDGGRDFRRVIGFRHPKRE
jgi:hypothetical protein